MFRWYQRKLAQRPLATQVITTAILFATGDVMSQQVVEKVGWDKHDYMRTVRLGGYGGVVFGPAATTWYKVLQKRVNLSSANKTIAARVGLDQLVFAPIHMVIFLSTMSVLEGTSPQKKLETTYKDAIQKNWMVWPWIQAVNFKLVPLEHRVLVVNVVSLGWNCYLSYINNKGN
ncbi:MAG: Protein required for ethanol metabolism [Cirrosporium novae-zelandiae]|nr:MAG: Protein required for ethanol metabolism [Cirrosporium novae-zelandiae]